MVLSLALGERSRSWAAERIVATTIVATETDRTIYTTILRWTDPDSQVGYEDTVMINVI
jgi:hypothetical protein